MFSHSKRKIPHSCISHWSLNLKPIGTMIVFRICWPCVGQLILLLRKHLKFFESYTYQLILSDFNCVSLRILVKYFLYESVIQSYEIFNYKTTQLQYLICGEFDSPTKYFLKLSVFLSSRIRRPEETRNLVWRNLINKSTRLGLLSL